MKRKLIYILFTLLIAANGFGFLYPQGKKLYYIYFDNSQSMKRFNFYQRMLGALAVNLENQGLDNEVEIKYIPFGTKWKIPIYDNYSDFNQWIKAKTYSTTDFVNLKRTLLRQAGKSPDSTFIIISDGEHDITNNPSFSNLSSTELRQMIDTIGGIRKNNLKLYSIHILKQYSNSRIKNMRGYYNNLKRNSGLMEGVEASVTNANVIAGLSRDFMKRIVSNSQDYYFCRDNKDAVKALFDIFEISMPMECDTTRFRRTVPLNITFGGMIGDDTKQWFRKSLNKHSMCMDGIRRTIISSPASSFFKLKIEFIDNDVYTIALNHNTFWKEKRLYDDTDMTKFRQRLITGIQDNIDSQFSNNPRFKAPECLLSIKFDDPKAYAFISPKNFQLQLRSCGKPEWQNAEVYFFDRDQRAFILVPMVVAESLMITPLDNKSKGKSFNLNKSKFNFWETIDFSVKQGDLTYPSLLCSFGNFFPEQEGALLFFSDETGRFVAMISSSQPGLGLKLFQNKRYQIYFVPKKLDEKNIKSITRTISQQSDLTKALELLKPTSVDITFNDWKDCLTQFTNAAAATTVNGNPNNNPAGKQNQVARQITKSNGYFLLLQHLGEIKNDPNNKQAFLDLLGETLIVYKNSDSSPFKAIDLLKEDIQGFSSFLKSQYLGMGDKAKMEVILLLLADPITNLTELKHFLNDKRQQVSLQNQKYFETLIN